MPANKQYFFGVIHDERFEEHRYTYGQSLRVQSMPRHKVRQQDIFLWLPLRRVKPSWRRGAQGIGDCVSWGAELAVTMLLAIQHELGVSAWIEEAATEPIYGGGRVEANGGQLGGWSDGSWGSAAAEWLGKWGVLLRLDYSGQTSVREHDLRAYSAQKAKQWGHWGCGGEADAGRGQGKLDQIAAVYPVKDVTPIRTVEEAAVALENGYSITVASGVGYGDMRRDGEGVVRRRGAWSHQMMLGGVRWKNGEPQFRQFQSWGDSSSGPDPGIEDEAISKCSWWCVAEDVQRQLDADDSFAFADVAGFPARDIDFLKAAETFG